MAEIGRADLVIVPRFDGLSSSINKALGGVDVEPGGAKVGTVFAGGMAKSIVAGNIITGALDKVVGVITEHMGDAVSRLDTMKNYGLVMENLGYGADAAEASIQKMSDRLQNLPTTLDSMVGTVQGLSVITGDLDKATDAGLALNDMLLASGSNTQLVNAAGEQFRQMLSKGKPEMQDWKSLMQAAPAQMQQLAKEMLGTTATTNDLYEALGGGGVDPTITMDELLDAMIRLDTEGGQGLASFQKQAETAQGGIETAFSNMGNAITKGLANVLDEIGRDKITGALDVAKSGINGFFDAMQGGVVKARDAMTLFNEAVSPANGRIESSITAVLSDLGQVPDAAAVASQSFSWLMDRTRQAYDEATRATNDYVARRQEHAAQSERIAAAYQEESSKLTYAESILDKYANTTGLSSAQQATFAHAIETVNELCGTNYQVVDASAGAYANEAGEIQNNTDAIKRNIEQRRAASKADSIGKEYDETEKDLAKATDSMGKWQATVDNAKNSLQGLYDKYGTNDISKISQEIAEAFANNEAGASTDLEALKKWGDACKGLSDSSREVMRHRKDLEELALAQTALSKSADGAELSLGELAASQQLVQTAFTGEGSKASLSMADFAQAIESCALNGDRLKEVLNDPNQLNGMIQAYDGTAESLRGFFEQAGIGWNDEIARQIDAKNRADELATSLDGMRAPLESASQQMMNMGFDQLIQGMADAGIQADTLSTMGLTGLSAAMKASNGDMNALIAIIQAWNAEPMYDKNGQVDVSGLSVLHDGFGMVYTWNGTELRNKNGEVVVDTVDLEDAQGKKMTWNGTELEDKSANAETNTDSVQTGIDRCNNWNGIELVDHFASGVINITRNVTDVFSSVLGGGHASGGFRGEPRFHADGGIATKAVPLDIVGEDGAEAIVPLTNRKYAKPFVDMIADELGHKSSHNITANFYITDASDPERVSRTVLRDIRQLADAE